MFFVLEPREQSFLQKQREWRSYKEVTRTREDGRVYCRDPNLARKILAEGHRCLIDPRGMFGGARPVSVKEAAEILGVPVPVVNRWAQSGKLESFSFGKQGPVFSIEDVEALAEARDKENA